MSMTIGRLVVALAAALVVQALSVAAEAKTVQLLAPGGGQVRALLVGIDKYSSRSIPTLKGAAADARDLNATLLSAGVSKAEITVLIDEQADRRSFEAAINRLVNDSKGGDLVIISYAGHGSQTPEHVKGSESDGMDEVFLLHTFDARDKTTERILDNEMTHWLLKLAKKKVDVLYVADTCHGGGMMRAPDFRAGELSYRFVAIDMEPQRDKLKPVSSISDAKVSPDDLPDVTFLAAVNKNSKAPEVSIPGNATLRGALSHAVARSLGKDEDGPVTRQQLFGYARQITYQYSETKQTITTEPAGSAAKLDKVVFLRKVIVDPATAPSTTPAVVPASEAIRLQISGGAANSLSGIAPGHFPFQLVKLGEPANVVWDVAKGDVLNGHGDVIAKSAKAADIPGIVDGVGALLAIKKMSEAAPQAVRLQPGDSLFRRGEVIRFEVEGLKGKFLILANLSGNGRVRFLFPLMAGDVAKVADQTFSLPLRVEEPFGSDHVIAIVSDQRLEEVEAAIRAIDDQKASGRFVGILQSLQQSNRSVRIGMSASFTAP